MDTKTKHGWYREDNAGGRFWCGDADDEWTELTGSTDQSDIEEEIQETALAEGAAKNAADLLFRVHFNDYPDEIPLVVGLRKGGVIHLKISGDFIKSCHEQHLDGGNPYRQIRRIELKIYELLGAS